MKKKISKVLLLSIFVCVFLSGCTSTTMIESRLESLNASNDEEFENERFEKLLEAVSEKDRSQVKEMFSIKALEEADDMEAGIDYLFEMIQGEVISFDSYGGPIVSETVAYGDKYVELKSWFDLVTDEETYRVFFLDNRVDTVNSDNVGFYSLRICKIENVETEFDSWQAMALPGIYIPEE